MRSSRARVARPDHAACSGCSLCLLVCPVWRTTRDLRLTPHGRAKALQVGATVSDITSSVESCTLCAACEPVCPERIDLVGMIIALRRELPRSAPVRQLEQRLEKPRTDAPAAQPTSRHILVVDAALRARQPTMTSLQTLLGCAVSEDDGADVALALECGAAIPPSRFERLLAPLRTTKRVIVSDGLLLRYLRPALRKTQVISLGEALTSIGAVRRALRAEDLYVIEPRAYHADRERLVEHYDRLRAQSGCSMNLDLLRMAIPATARDLHQRLGLRPADDSAHARWILEERRIARIVVENVEDIAAFAQTTDIPVIHAADLIGSADVIPDAQHAHG
jgi:ferredoxin